MAQWTEFNIFGFQSMGLEGQEPDNADTDIEDLDNLMGDRTLEYADTLPDDTEPFDAENAHGTPLQEDEIPGYNSVLSPDDFDEAIELADEGYPEEEVPNEQEATELSQERSTDEETFQDDPSTVDEFDEVDLQTEVTEYEEVDERDEIDADEETAETEPDADFYYGEGEGFTYQDDPEEREGSLQDPDRLQLTEAEEALVEDLLDSLENEGFDVTSLEEFLFPEDETPFDEEFAVPEGTGPGEVESGSDSDVVSPDFTVVDYLDNIFNGEEDNLSADGEPLGDADGLDIVDGLDDVDAEGPLDLPIEVEDWFGLDFDFGVDDDAYSEFVIVDPLGGDFSDATFEQVEDFAMDWVADELDDLGWELDFV